MISLTLKVRAANSNITTVQLEYILKESKLLRQATGTEELRPATQLMGLPFHTSTTTRTTTREISRLRIHHGAVWRMFFVDHARFSCLNI
jgi:putative component of toxin-antitoxin plasmid stabilization module